MLILFLRSLLCNICYLFFIIAWFSLLLFAQIIFSRKIFIKINSKFINFFFYSLKICGNIKYEIKGNIPNDNQYWVYASKHQSSLEIYLLASILQCPSFIVKKSLFFIPLLRTYMNNAGSFGVDRKNGIKAMREMKKKIKISQKISRNLVIFPEGTRTKSGENGKILPGIFMLYKMGMPIVPVALNTGKFWPKNSFFRKSGVITIQFLPPIQEKNLTKEEFLQRLENDINQTSLSLL